MDDFAARRAKAVLKREAQQKKSFTENPIVQGLVVVMAITVVCLLPPVRNFMSEHQSLFVPALTLSAIPFAVFILTLFNKWEHQQFIDRYHSSQRSRSKYD